MHVEKILQDATVQALAGSRFDVTADLLPTKIEKVFEVPKLWEMIQATSKENVQGFIEFELIKLAERINVSGNLTSGQIQEIAAHLVETYKNETIADFKICFERAAKGTYGKIWKLDGIEVGLWIKAYLEEKYIVREGEWNKQKEDEKNNVYSEQHSDWLRLWKEAIEMTDKSGGVKTQSQNMAILSNLRGMTDNEVEQEGQVKPQRKTYYSLSESEVKAKDKHFRYISANYDSRTREKLECWMPEDHWNSLND